MKIAILISMMGLMVFSCERKDTSTDETVEPVEKTLADDAKMGHEAQREKAAAADRTLRQRLLARVMEVVAEDGHAAAVTVCREEALPITKEIADEFGVSMGRISDRLRNPTNTAPDWVSTLIEEAGPEAGKESIEVATEEAFLRVSPLHIAAPCLACHGPQDTLSEEVTQAVERYYPEDKAVGYAEGDLRGWVWVRVPN